MSARLAPTAAPANCLKIWADTTRIYAELPGTVPCVMAFDRSGHGLSKVLNLIYARESHGAIVNPSLPSRKLVGTAAQHDLAQALLRRKGIIR
jgi:hypothetical protein